VKSRDHLILTAIGPDQVGLVEKLSKFISGRGCNIEDSKMAVFCGEFAVIILISGDPTDLRKISDDSQEVAAGTGLSIATKKPVERTVEDSFLPYRLVASCMDHTGIVYQISGILSSFGINIESMETKTYPAPVSATPLFRLEATLSIPVRSNINKVRESMMEIQRELNVDIEIAPIKP